MLSRPPSTAGEVLTGPERLSTITHQPPVSDFGAYARYVSSDVFLISHLGASIFGAACCSRSPGSRWPR
jgi:hypothetical protein